MAQRFKFVDGEFVRFITDDAGKWVRASEITGGGSDFCAKAAELLEKAPRSSGELKFRNAREKATFYAYRAWDQLNCTEARIKRDAKALPYWPKTASEYAAMAGFDGRVAQPDGGNK